jgi:hypothetical protein
MMIPKNTLLVDPGRGFVPFPLLVCSFRFTLQSYGPKSTQGQTLTTLVCAHGCIIFRSFGQGSVSGFSSFIIFSLNSDICQGSSAVVTASSALEKVKRADWRLTDNAAGCLAQNSNGDNRRQRKPFLLT